MGLSLPRATATLLPTQSGPQNPTGALGISPSCRHSAPQPLALPGAASAEQPLEMGQERGLQRGPSPTWRGAAEIAATGTCALFWFRFCLCFWFFFFLLLLKCSFLQEGILSLEAAALLQDKVIAELRVPNDGSSSVEGGKRK